MTAQDREILKKAQFVIAKLLHEPKKKVRSNEKLEAKIEFQNYLNKKKKSA